MRHCSVDGCERKHEAGGYCSAHYDSLRLRGDPLAAKRRAPSGASLAERLEFYADRSVGPDSCWFWRGTPHGPRGVLSHGGRLRQAHVWAWMGRNGPVPSGLVVRHDCDQPRCVNPSHLRIGTHADNTADMVARGRMRRNKSRSPRLGMGRAEEIRSLYASGGWTHVGLAERFGVHRATIGRILNGGSYRPTGGQPVGDGMAVVA